MQVISLRVDIHKDQERNHSTASQDQGLFLKTNYFVGQAYTPMLYVKRIKAGQERIGEADGRPVADLLRGYPYSVGTSSIAARTGHHCVERILSALDASVRYVMCNQLSSVILDFGLCVFMPARPQKRVTILERPLLGWFA